MISLKQRRMDAIDWLEDAYLRELVEDGRDGTNFDLEIMDVFNELRVWVSSLEELS